MGRRKIDINYITDISQRSVSLFNVALNSGQMCFLKRKRGLIKKAIELSKLTGAKVYLTVITEDDMTATSYKSAEQDLYSQAIKVKTLETFGENLDFDVIKNCTKSETNHTIGQKHIKLLAEEGLVQVKYDKDAKEGAKEILRFHDTLSDKSSISELCQPAENPVPLAQLGKRSADCYADLAQPKFVRVNREEKLAGPFSSNMGMQAFTQV